MPSKPPQTPSVRSWETLRRMIGRFRPVRKAAVVVLGLLLVRSAVEIAHPRLVAAVIESLEVHIGKTTALPSTFLWMIAALAVALLLKQVLLYISSVAAMRVGQDVENRLRSDLFQQVLRLRFRYHDKNRTGETIARSLRDMEQAKHFYREVWFGYVDIGLLLVAVLGAVFWTHWSFGLVALVIYGTGVLICIQAGRQIARLDRVVCDDYDEVVSALTENVAGARVVRAFGRERDESVRFGQRMDTMTASWSRIERFWTGVMPLVGHMYSLCTPFLLMVGAWRISQGTGTLGELVAAILYCRTVQYRMRPLTRLVILGQKAVASASRVFEVLDTHHYVEVLPPQLPLANAGAALSFENVHFGHDEDTPVLRGVTLDVPAGTSLGLIGPTGSGKTSLVQLVPRFYDPDEGVVRLDGVDVRQLDPDALRREVSLVFQEAFLFSDTVAANVAYARPDATRAEVEHACKLAAADAFVRELPEGYETVIGERGVSLSGGQRQRLTIARALLQDPSLLILDDATASVDAVTERALFDGIEEVAANRTTVVISQRVPSVRWCDRIAVLDGGVVTAVGTHEELLTTSPLYAEIHEHQLLTRSAS